MKTTQYNNVLLVSTVLTIITIIAGLCQCYWIGLLLGICNFVVGVEYSDRFHKKSKLLTVNTSVSAMVALLSYYKVITIIIRKIITILA